MKYFFSFIFFFFLHVINSQTPVFNPALSPRIANYDISVSLNTQNKIITGNETLHWKNISSDTISEMHFHLYLNAFKNNQSTWLQEAGGVPRHAFIYEAEENIWGYCDMQKIVDENGNDLTATLQFIQPEDGNEYDQTVAVITLAKPILPQQSITLNIDFESKLPRAMVRTGYSKDYYFAVQWFPKVGVYEPAGLRCAEVGQWNCHQYHRAVEYYADYGVYQVDIEVPANYIVGASGQLLEKEEKKGRVTHSYYVEDVIDFAWTASPDFLEIKDAWEGVDIRLLIYPEHENLSYRYLNTVKKTLDYFKEKFEKYPYPTLTIVVTPLHGAMTSSMEYPTLFSAPAIAHLPEGIRFPETLTAHEFIHQYFMQMVATNEQEESWLDEGITNFYEGKVLDEIFGKQRSAIDMFDFQYGNIESNRESYFGIDFPKIAAIASNNWEFPGGTSHSIPYSKTTLWLTTFERLVGTSTFDEVMKTYFLKWKFKHPCGRDFIEIANEVVAKNHGDKFGNSMDWFFDQVVYGTDACDYEIGYIANRKKHAPTGIIDDKNNPIRVAGIDKSKEGLKSSVLVYRSGEMKMPVEVLIHFEDGLQVLEYWDGKARSIEYEYDKHIDYAIVDPEEKIYIDENFLNNRRSTSAETTGIKKYVSKFFYWMQNVMQTVSCFV